MSQPIRIILVGLGARGRYWRRVIHDEPRAHAVAFVDPLDHQRRAFRELEPNVPDFADLPAAIDAHEADAIVFATPPGTRAQHLALAFERRIPVLVEKPLSLDLQEAHRFVRAARESETPLMVGLNFRYLDVTKKTRELLASGVVGDAEFGRFTYERWRDGERPGINRYPMTMEHPMLWEQSIHHVDLMRYVYDDEPTTVYAHTYNPSWTMYAGDTNVSAIFHFASGRVVTYQGTWQANHAIPNFEWRTECSNGVIYQNDQFGELAFARRHDEQAKTVDLEPHETWVTDTAGVLSAFVAHLLDGQPLECSGEDHLRSIAMIEACVRSNVNGQPVSVSAILESLENDSAHNQANGCRPVGRSS